MKKCIRQKFDPVDSFYLFSPDRAAFIYSCLLILIFYLINYWILKKKKKKKKNQFNKIEKYVEKFWQKIGDVISAQRLISCLCVPHPIICIESEMN